jgi:molybdopterin converting factor small subunit
MTLVPTKEQDYLEEDPVLRGQNYVCLSFLSPEDLLANKEVYCFQEYVKSFVADINKVADEVTEKFPEVGQVLKNLKDSYPHMFDASVLQDDYRFFKQSHSDRLEKEFHEQNEFRTSVRGIKVRGVFDTLKEAQTRAEVLKRMGDKFDIFIGQVGCWCPWSPNPEDIQNQEYAETQLNTFMKQFKENMALKDKIYEERKKERTTTTSAIVEELSKQDTWTSRQEDEQK